MSFMLVLEPLRQEPLLRRTWKVKETRSFFPKTFHVKGPWSEMLNLVYGSLHVKENRPPLLDICYCERCNIIAKFSQAN